jgi:hypothetical protein
MSADGKPARDHMRILTDSARKRTEAHDNSVKLRIYSEFHLIVNMNKTVVSSIFVGIYFRGYTFSEDVRLHLNSSFQYLLWTLIVRGYILRMP